MSLKGAYELKQLEMSYSPLTGIVFVLFYFDDI